jgi:GT2 family glycosyltransferase
MLWILSGILADIRYLVWKSSLSIRDEGILLFLSRLKNFLLRRLHTSTRGAMPSKYIMVNYEAQYQSWLSYHGPQTMRGSLTCPLHDNCKELAPLITVIMPIYKSNLEFLRTAIQSVFNQQCQAWALCIYDDGSNSQKLTSFVADLCKNKTGRVNIIKADINRGIAFATEQALSTVATPFVGFLDHDDYLWPNAILEVCKVVQKFNDVDLIYTDEDRINEIDEHYDPIFKPGWSPLFLLTGNYLAHFTVARTCIIKNVGGINVEMSGAQDYDLYLRITEVARRIEHIDKICYSWRSHSRSTAQSIDAKPYALTAGRHAISSALARRNISAEVSIHPLFKGIWKIQRTFQSPPSVGIIICSATPAYAESCVRSILEATKYPHYSILVIHNVISRTAKERFEKISALDTRIRIMHVHSQPFNYSFVNNYAASHVKCEYYCLLNDDVVVKEGGWIDELLGVFIDPSYAIAGGLLYYPNGSIQHAGIILGIGGIAGHAFRKFGPNHHSYHGLSQKARDVSGVTFAMCLIRADIYQELGGLDEVNVPLSYSDVDFCLRAAEKGYRIAFTPFARAVHMESATRGYERAELGQSFMRRRWYVELSKDHYYNVNCTLRDETYSIIP